MKGIEGLPLKYLILILVGVIVIGVVLSIVGQFGTQAQQSGQDISNTTGTLVANASANACKSQGCTWDDATTTCTC